MQLKTLLALVLVARGLPTCSAASLHPAELSPNRFLERQTAFNNTDQTAVQQRVTDLWAQVEQDKPIQAPAIQQVVTNITKADYDPGASINETPFQPTYRDSKAAELTFPAGFEYGVAAAAPQIEGAVKADGRGPSIWDWFGHRTNGMRNNDTFDIAVNFRYLYPLDLKRIAAMGVKTYSLSISWSRVMPLGSGYVSQEGLDFYKNLTREVVKNGMKPVVTLFHWDTPLALEQDYGSFTSERIVDDFTNYAALMFKELGAEGVNTWITFNEPPVFCMQRFLLPLPSIRGLDAAPKNASWQCSGNLLKAHGRTYELFDEMRNNGTIPSESVISYKNSGSVNAPYNESSQADWDNIERQVDFGLGLFAEPIHGSGNYPEVVQKEVPKDWLPELTAEDQKRLSGSADFFSTDYYSSSVSKHLNDTTNGQCIGNNTHPSWPNCAESSYTLSNGWALGEQFPDSTCAAWLTSTSAMLTRHLDYIAKRWPTRKGIYVTEFGWAEKDEAAKTQAYDIRMDDGRQRYYSAYLNELLLAVNRNNTPVSGVYLWSATSNVEWEVGLEPRFGLQSVDYKSPQLTRTYLGSFYLVRDFMRKHLLSA